MRTMTLTPGTYPAPPDRTARRLEWPFLPPNVRAYVERRCGSPVAQAISQTSGFTPGFASVLVCEDGSRHFVKAASVKAQRVFADSYREEARKLSALPASVPAPPLRWLLDDDWVVLGIEHVAARAPRRPWRQGDLDASLDALEAVADELTPAPRDLDLDTFVDEFHGFLDGWAHVRENRPDLPHLEEAIALAHRYAEVCPGDTVVHTDVRADNLLIDDAGKVWICDWNWPVLGAAWLDSLFTLIGPRGDGLDVDRVISERRLLADVPAESVDIVLALLIGYFLSACDQPVPPTSPHLRDHQRWQGEVCWAWLAERRGWS
jgi:hypothetical protein